MQRKPNILFFLVDDMGWQDTSVPFHTEVTELNRRYRTPHMERLAAQWVKFTQAYACSLCSPTRVSLMTGMNAARHMVTNWTLRRDQETDTPREDVRSALWNVNGLCREPGVPRTVQAVTLAELLGKAGYRTIHCGKGHLGAHGTPGADPRNLGFEVNIAGHAAGGPGSYYGTNNFSAAWRDGDLIWDVPGLEKYHGQDINLTEALTREGIAEIEKSVEGDRPFYLYMSHYAIHAPFEKDDRFFKPYEESGLPEFESTYASMIESQDDSLGKFLDCLERLGIQDDTVVIFMTDNGQPKQVPRNRPLRGHKLTPYEGGVRVPLIVKWPGVTEPGSACGDTPVIVEDIFPTFLEIAGAPGLVPADGTIDGVSFVPLLERKGPYPQERSLFWHYPNTYDQPPFSSVRRGDWKLIYFHADGTLELYDIASDISERNDLAQAEGAKVRELSKILSDHLRKTGAKMTVDLRTDAPVPYPDEVC